LSSACWYWTSPLIRTEVHDYSIVAEVDRIASAAVVVKEAVVVDLVVTQDLPIINECGTKFVIYSPGW
jgi:hypothetical protein